MEDLILLGYRLKHMTVHPMEIVSILNNVISATFPKDYLTGHDWETYAFDLRGYEANLKARNRRG